MTKPWAKEINREKLGKNGIPVSSGAELLWLGINSLDAPFLAGPEGEGILLNHRTVWVGKDHGQGHLPLAQVTQIHVCSNSKSAKVQTSELK